MSKIPPRKRKGPRFSPHFIKRLSSWLVLSTALTIAVRSATLYFDNDGTGVGNATTGPGLGGSGTWENGGANADWWSAPNPTLQTWNNANSDTATFVDTPGTVTLNGNITAAKLVFNRGGFNLVAGTAPNLTLNDPAGIVVNALASNAATTI